MILSFLKISSVSLNSFYFKKMNFLNLNENKLLVSRNQSIIALYNNTNLYIHQGRTWVRIKGSKYHVGYKAGMFSPTKKPFHFKSKKKKAGRNLRR